MSRDLGLSCKTALPFCHTMRRATRVRLCEGFRMTAQATRYRREAHGAMPASGAPNVRPGCGVDELSGDAHAIRGLAHTAFEHITHAKLAADLLHVGCPALVGECRIARDDEQPLDARQASSDILHHAVGEIFLLRIAAHVLEGQNSNGWLVGQRKSLGNGRLRVAFSKPDPIDPYWSGDVLELLLADILAGKSTRPLISS